MTSLPSFLPKGLRVPRLTPAECEVILVFNDAEGTWSIRCDSRSLGGYWRKVLARAGIQVQLNGAGFEAEGIPKWVIRGHSKRAVSEQQRVILARAREARQKAHLDARGSARAELPALPAARPELDSGAGISTVRGGVFSQAGRNE